MTRESRELHHRPASGRRRPQPDDHPYARRRVERRASLPGPASWPGLLLARLYLDFATTLPVRDDDR